jgi:hypothetical protein
LGAFVRPEKAANGTYWMVDLHLNGRMDMDSEKGWRKKIGD